MIKQLVYSSVATEAFDDEQFEKIEAASLIYNPLRGITGMLAFDGQRFIQLIEGPTAAVDSLYERLGHDARHRDLQLLYREDAEFASFGEWAMRCVRLAPTGREREAAIDRLLPPLLAAPIRNLLLKFGRGF